MLDVCMEGVPKVQPQLLALQIHVNQLQLPVAQEWAFPQSCPWHREAVAPVRGALLRTFTPSCQGLLDLCSILSYLPSRCILILLVLDYLAYQGLYQNSFLVQISLEPMIVPCTGLIMELQQPQPFNIKMKVSVAFSNHILICGMLCSFDCSTLFAVNGHLGRFGLQGDLLVSVLTCTNDWLVWCQQHLITCLRTIGIHGVYKQLQWQARPVLKALLPHVNLHTVPHDKAMGWKLWFSCNESKHANVVENPTVGDCN